MVSALRSLLRFLHVAGYIARPLDTAVPAVPGWQPVRDPHRVSGREIAAVLAACDRESARGRRDYAILMLLARLGLRAAEVAGIRLGDIDWQQGVLTVRGKGSALDELPVPADVGAAMADYVRHGRPRSSSAAALRERPGAVRGAVPGIGRLGRAAGMRAGRPGPVSGRTGSATPWPASSSATAPRWKRSVSSSASATRAPRHGTQPSMPPRSLPSPVPAPKEPRDEHPARARHGLPGDAPQPGLQARWPWPPADEVHRLPGRPRPQHRHHRGCHGLGGGAGRHDAGTTRTSGCRWRGASPATCPPSTRPARSRRPA